MPQTMDPSPTGRKAAAAIDPPDHLTEAAQSEGLANQIPVAQE
jgi:hypothetical protein